MVAKLRLHLQKRVPVDLRSGAGVSARGRQGNPLLPEKETFWLPGWISWTRKVHQSGPVSSSRSRTVCCKLVGDPRRAENVEGLGGDMVVADKGVDPHEVVHVGMGDEQCGDRFHYTLGTGGESARNRRDKLSLSGLTRTRRSGSSRRPAKKVGSRKRKGERVIGDLKIPADADKIQIPYQSLLPSCSPL